MNTAFWYMGSQMMFLCKTVQTIRVHMCRTIMFGAISNEMRLTSNEKIMRSSLFLIHYQQQMYGMFTVSVRAVIVEMDCGSHKIVH